MKKMFLIIALALTMVFGATTALFAASDSTFVHINTYVVENVGNTGIRATTQALGTTYTTTEFDTLFFNSISDVTMAENVDISSADQTGEFYVLARRTVNSNIEIKVTGSPLSLIGYPDAKLRYSVKRVGHPNDKFDTNPNYNPSSSFTYTVSPVGGIVRGYDKFIYFINQSTTASSGSYSATITFEITTP